MITLCASAAAQAPAGPITTLYRRISNLGLDPKHVYNVRGAGIDREDVHFSLDDGTLAFTEAVDGKITGAVFEGEGTALIVPPDAVEKHSLGMFTGSAVMNKRFTTAYFRFDDSHFISDLRPYLQPLEDGAAFVEERNSVTKTMAAADALRLLLSLTRGTADKPETVSSGEFIHGRFVGPQGTFDVSWDTATNEQIAAGQISYSPRGVYYDQWLLFPMRSVRQRDYERQERGLSSDEFYADEIGVSDYKIHAEIRPPTELAVDAALTLTARVTGERVVLLELSRYLKVSSATMERGGSTVPLEVIQNEAIEGTELARRGNDIVAIGLPEPMTAGQSLNIHVSYAGDVLSEAGGGLLYVGARGAWYPNRGPAMADFTLDFQAPVEWKVLATGRLQSKETHDGIETTRWASERPIPLAGFNLGKYVAGEAKTADGKTAVYAYATEGMENTFPVAALPPQVVRGRTRPQLPAMQQPMSFIPAKNAEMVAKKSSETIDFLSQRLGPFPYSSLLLTQMPGPNSQGWPGLIYLSSHVFLTPTQRSEGRAASYPESAEELIYNHLMEAHETAHQWWGDAIIWQTYRDQWLMEALANYCALMEIEAHSPEEAKAVLGFYREGLETPATGETLPRKNAGPVSFGIRLNSAPFPNAYEAVAYGRGTWLLHMLREMLRETPETSAKSRQNRKAPVKTDVGEKDPDAVFISVLRNLQKRYEGKSLSTSDLQLAFEEVWPKTIRYEGKKSLNWFFDGWVNGIAVPKYELKDVRISVGAKTVATFTLMQNEAPDSLVTSVPIYAQAPGGLVYVDRVFADGNETSVKLTVPAGTKKLVVDPYETLLRVK